MESRDKKPGKRMKIGLLAYHSAINYGATLQLLSTYMYLKNHGHEPVVINWVPSDLEAFYVRRSTEQQRAYCRQIRQQIWHETSLCRTAEEVAREVEAEHIDAVIVGSDAVAQHHPAVERAVFPCRRIVYIQKYTSDRMFPNPFWGQFNDYLPRPVPVAVMSASSQDSAYPMFTPWLKRRMRGAIERYAYISVRDTWTQAMVEHVTDGKRCPAVTPDPVFAFNDNASSLVPGKAEILERYGLPEPYILLSFKKEHNTVTQEWLETFEAVARQEGYTSVLLPFPDVPSFGRLDHQVSLPLSPLDWYALIRYSAGYVGHNMHPIVVSLHNAVPFFSFDNYGKKLLGGRRYTDQSSKILHLLDQAELTDYRISCLHAGFTPPAAAFVFHKLRHCPVQKEQAFADAYARQYRQMMTDITAKLISSK